MTTATPVTAEYTFPELPRWVRPGPHDGQTVFGEVVDIDAESVYVRWEGGTKDERFARHNNPEGVTFKDASGAVIR